jgi:hypothetical protein
MYFLGLKLTPPDPRPRRGLWSGRHTTPQEHGHPRAAAGAAIPHGRTDMSNESSAHPRECLDHSVLQRKEFQDELNSVVQLCKR